MSRTAATDRLDPTVGPEITGNQTRRDLQGMRAVAVLVVFADHLFNWPSGGFVGVDMFFVLSGFFITGILLRERRYRGRISFTNFYVRRVKRILPSALLVLVVTVAAAHYLFPAVRAKETLLDALWAAIFGANIRFEAVGADYFQQDQPPSPIQHYWSLSIEEQFYFVWPVLLLLLFTLTRRAHRRGNTWFRQMSLFAGMAVIVGASFAWAMYLSEANPNAAYFSTFTRVWELGVGALMAIAGSWLVRIPTSIRPVLAYLGLAGVVASLLLIDSTVQFPAPWAALPVLSTALIIASFHGAQVRGMLPLTNPVARWFGDTSYTLYLWHWPVIILLESVLPRGPLFYALALTLALGLTAATYHFFEDPIRKSHWLLHTAERKGRLPSIGLHGWALVGGVAALLVVVSILGIRYSDQIAANEEVVVNEEQGDVDLAPPAADVDPCFGAPAMVNGACVLRNPDVPLRPSIDRFAEDRRAGKGCFRADETILKSCTYGYTGEDAVRVALVGDSHAGSLLPAILPLLEENKWKLTTYVGIGCQWQVPMLAECKGGEAVQPALLIDPFDLVVTTASRRATATVEEYVAAWAPVAAAGSRIAVLQALPDVSADSLACLTRVSIGGDRTGECGTSSAEAFALPDPQIAAAQQVPGTTLIDLTPFYCNTDRCPSVIGNVIVYRDAGGHLTRTFANTLALALQDGLRGALNGRPAG
jgi:peptidoglycan/LPS O-acetylase OafA/YrhL